MGLHRGCAFLLAASCAAQVSLLIDTDLSTSVGDAGALCVAHALADRGEASIAGVVHDTAISAGADAISAINHFFGRDEVLVGAYTGAVGAGDVGARPFLDELVGSISGPRVNASQAPSALSVYRASLAAAADGSITLLSLGFLTNLLELLQSNADAASPLAGSQLVAQKVRALVLVGGRYPRIGDGTIELGPNGPRRVRHPVRALADALGLSAS